MQLLFLNNFEVSQHFHVAQPVFKVCHDSVGIQVWATDTNKVTNLSKAKVSQQRK